MSFSVCTVKVNLIEITENLFFAIFGQKDTEDFILSRRKGLQPKWTVYFFKVRKKQTVFRNRFKNFKLILFR